MSSAEKHEDFCPSCGSDTESGPGGLPCALCFMNQPGEPLDEGWDDVRDTRRDPHGPLDGVEP